MLNVTLIKSTMAELGLTGAKLGALCDVSKEAVSNWLSGESIPRPSKLQGLASALKVSIEDLFVPDPEEQPAPVVAFRTRSNRPPTAEALEAGEDIGRHLRQLVPFMGPLFAPRHLVAPIVDEHYIESVASAVRQHLHLGPTEAVNHGQLLALLKEFGAVLIPIYWGGDKVGHENAMSVYLPESKVSMVLFNVGCRLDDFSYWLAHELGHFVLHRDSHASFNCDKESIYTGADTLKQIEREADEFASNLLMPGDLLRQRITGKRIDFHLLGELAKEFGVSLEAMCIRLIKFTEQRAVLVYWDYGYLKYQWRSQSAIRTRVRLRSTDDPQEPLPDTLAADEDIVQEWDGIQMPAENWCSSEPPSITLREMKHSYPGGNRVLSLLVLESAAPRKLAGSGWEDERDEDSYDRFNKWGSK